MTGGSDVLERLYAVDREEFVAERKKLVRMLREQGRAPEASEVAALRKPPLPAFLANRLARERPRELSALLDAAEKLSTAHRSGDPDKLRVTQARLGEALRELVAAAPDVAGRPVSETVGQRLADTLRAAAIDEEAAALLRRGILPDEVEAGGFDVLAGMPLGQSAGTRKEPRAPRRSQRRDAARRTQAERVERELEEAKRELRAAENALTGAERHAKRARKRVADLEARAERTRAQ